MSIITLTTDFHRNDYYLAAIKSKLLDLAPDANIVDIAHDAQLQDKRQLAYLIKSMQALYPKGTTHLISIMRDYRKLYKILAIAHQGNYFVGIDNGAFFMGFGNQPKNIVQLDNPPESKRWPIETTMVPAAAAIAKTQKIKVVGKATAKILELPALQPTFSGNMLQGMVVNINAHGNVITNINQELFNRVHKERAFIMYLKSPHVTINKFSYWYDAEEEGNVIAGFNRLEHIEISMVQGNAARMLGYEIGDSVRIQFKD